MNINDLIKVNFDKFSQTKTISLDASNTSVLTHVVTEKINNTQRKELENWVKYVNKALVFDPAMSSVPATTMIRISFSGIEVEKSKDGVSIVFCPTSPSSIREFWLLIDDDRHINLEPTMLGKKVAYELGEENLIYLCEANKIEFMCKIEGSASRIVTFAGTANELKYYSQRIYDILNDSHKFDESFNAFIAEAEKAIAAANIKLKKKSQFDEEDEEDEDEDNDNEDVAAKPVTRKTTQATKVEQPKSGCMGMLVLLIVASSTILGSVISLLI